MLNVNNHRYLFYLSVKSGGIPACMYGPKSFGLEVYRSVCCLGFSVGYM